MFRLKFDRRLSSIDKKQFCDMLCNFFRSYPDEVTSTQEIECIRLSLQHFESYLRHKYLGDVYVEFIFSLFEKFRTVNSDLIRNTFQEYVLRALVDIDMSPPAILPEDKDNNYAFLTISENWTVDYFLIQAHLFLNSEVMKRLFRYGVQMKLDYDELFKHMYHYFLRELPRKNKILLNRMDMEQFHAALNENYPNTSDRKRLSLIVLAAKVLLQRSAQAFEEGTKSLKMLFKTVTDPFITVQDLSRFLNIIFRDDKKSLIENICQKFAEKFPSSKDGHQPRILKHLCRCKVRESLTKKLPHGIWSLGLSKCLENYVLIQRTEDEFYPKYVSTLVTGKRPPDDSAVLQKKQKFEV